MKKLVITLLLLFSLTLFSQIKGTGGPDSFGYEWKDSDEIDGPIYAWYDISSTGTALNLTDESYSAQLSLGFTFNYYGTDHTSIRVFDNGYLSFTSLTMDYSQNTIPTSASPNDLIAPFWSDLDPGAQGNVYYLYDSANSRFVVQYENVVQWGTSNGNTFQVFFYETGEIIYQYKDMQGNLSDCSIGIENDLGTVGLQVVYNSTYLKNNLAIKFEIPEVDSGGTYSISTNTLSYGNVNVGNSLAKNFTISNLHTSETMDCEITTITDFTVTEVLKTTGKLNKVKNVLDFSVNPESSIQFNLVFEPLTEQTYNGYVIITTSDVSNPTDSITVSGAGVNPDILVSQADTLKIISSVGESSGSSFDISNTGLGDLLYSVNVNYENDLPYKGAGGPDPYGYFWKDSSEPDGPAYDWFDISTIGTALTISSEESFSSSFPIGFSFNFYGSSFNTLFVSDNGYISFTGDNSDWANSIIPNASEPNGIICGYWTDMSAHLQGNVYYYYDSSNSRLIVQYQDILNYGTSIANTFQMILYADGSIEYQYKEINPNVNHTVGIENLDGTVATQICYNNSEYLKNSFAVKFVPTVNWLTVAPTSSTIPYNDSDQIMLTCLSSNLPEGKYCADLNIASNDPDTPNYIFTVEYTLYEMNSPENITVSVVGSTLTLNWDPVQYATGYVVYSTDDPYGSYTIDGSGTFINESWSTTVSNAKKFYRVVAVDSE